jgi:riboflavin kinase/FMN adenylyltransferase
VVALGNFDGVHCGHQALLAHAPRSRLRRSRCRCSRFTFEPHPRGFFVPDTGPFRLTLATGQDAAAGRVRRAGGAGAALRRRVRGPYRRGSFIADVLLKGLGARHVVGGYDFTFGARRSGNVEHAARREPGPVASSVSVLDPVTREGEIYSSTRIREALRARLGERGGRPAGPWLGDRRQAVELGDQRGRTIGFPTANVALGEHLRPRFGVYAVRALVDGQESEGWRNGVANLGKRPTFGKLQENFEVHLFDFAGDLYGKVLRVALVDFIRPEMKFAGLDQLKAQIAADGDGRSSPIARDKLSMKSCGRPAWPIPAP